MVLYGENSPIFEKILKSFKNRNVVHIDAGSTFMPFLYVGNAAWAHVLAAKCILTKPEVIVGQCYNITDDTPVQSCNDMMKPLVLASDYSISKVPISVRVMYFITLLLEWLMWFVSPFVSLRLPFTSNDLFLVSANMTFAGRKAKRDFEYVPIYSTQHAAERTKRFCRVHYGYS